jgi:hypothetical protein
MTAGGACDSPCHSEGAGLKRVGGRRLEKHRFPGRSKIEATEESQDASREGPCHP